MGCRTGNQVHDMAAAVKWKPEWEDGCGRFREELSGSTLVAIAVYSSNSKVKVGEGCVDRIKGETGLWQQGRNEVLGE